MYKSIAKVIRSKYIVKEKDNGILLCNIKRTLECLFYMKNNSFYKKLI